MIVPVLTGWLATASACAFIYPMPEQEAATQDEDNPSQSTDSTDDASDSEENSADSNDAQDSQDEDAPQDNDDPWWAIPGKCGEGCDLFDPKTCDQDERCAPWICKENPTDFDSWDDTICAPVGKKKLGESCKAPWAAKKSDSCGRGLSCWGSCVENCVGTRKEPKCEDKNKSCIILNRGYLAVCRDTCDPQKPKCDEEEPTCIPNGKYGDAFVCAPAGIDTLGQYGDSCASMNHCEGGLFCIKRDFVKHDNCAADATHCCTEFCDTDKKGKDCSAKGAKCVPFYGEGTKPPKKYKDLGVCDNHEASKRASNSRALAPLQAGHPETTFR